jgi:hypothetical protein
MDMCKTTKHEIQYMGHGVKDGDCQRASSYTYIHTSTYLPTYLVRIRLQIVTAYEYRANGYPNFTQYIPKFSIQGAPRYTQIGTFCF